MAAKPKREVNANADKFLINARGNRMNTVNRRILEVRWLRCDGTPADARRGVKTSPNIPE